MDELMLYRTLGCTGEKVSTVIAEKHCRNNALPVQRCGLKSKRGAIEWGRYCREKINKKI